MVSFVARRILQMLIVLFVVSVTTFVIMRILPGDPVSVMVGLGPVSDETVQAMRDQMGLDDPLYLQYVTYMADILTGDLGTSAHTGKPVFDDLIHRLPASAELAFFALSFGLLIGIPLGVIAAIRRNSALDRGIRLFTVSGVSVPVFWLGIILVYFLYYRLDLVPPPDGRVSQEFDDRTTITGIVTLDAVLTGNFGLFKDAAGHLLLPMLTLSYESLAIITRMVRSSMLEVLSKQYVTVSRSKGLRERSVIVKHALRNAVIPLVTVVALAVGRLLGGAVLVETVYNWPGAGRYVVDSLLARDYSPVQGFILFSAATYALINLVVDISYGFLDPRIHYK
ncbi:MAG: peptide/nickel transport system permease protein [Thermomicrobiales bacterium]|nr:peptide/nickel transport system permease protein [Thermomicrobiales bacterium]